MAAGRGVREEGERTGKRGGQKGWQHGLYTQERVLTRSAAGDGAYRASMVLKKHEDFDYRRKSIGPEVHPMNGDEAEVRTATDQMAMPITRDCAYEVCAFSLDAGDKHQHSEGGQGALRGVPSATVNREPSMGPVSGVCQG